MQNIGSKVLVVFEAVVMDITGPEGSPLLIVQDDAGARYKFTPAQCLDGSVVMSINQRDTVEDQFTGEDLGAQMAEAEAEPEKSILARMIDKVLP